MRYCIGMAALLCTVGCVGMELTKQLKKKSVELCAICYEPIEGIKITLACKHSFCEGCINGWRKRMGISATCPTCRGAILQPAGWALPVMGVDVDDAIGIHQPTFEKPVESSSSSEMPAALCMTAAALALTHHSSDIRPSAPPFEMSYEEINVRSSAFSGAPAMAPVQTRVEAPAHVERHRRRECCLCDPGCGEVCIFGCPCCIPCIFCLAWCNDCCCNCG